MGITKACQCQNPRFALSRDENRKQGSGLVESEKFIKNF